VLLGRGAFSGLSARRLSHGRLIQLRQGLNQDAAARRAPREQQMSTAAARAFMEPNRSLILLAIASAV